MTSIVGPSPDAEAIVSKALRDAGVCGGRVYSSIPKKNPVYPLATVKRLGGNPLPYVDQARIQVDVWGENKAQARDESDAARVAAHSLEGTTSTEFTANVSAVRDELGLTFLPDPDTARDRYLFTVIVFVRSL